MNAIQSKHNEATLTLQDLMLTLGFFFLLSYDYFLVWVFTPFLKCHLYHIPIQILKLAVAVSFLSQSAVEAARMKRKMRRKK